MLKRLNILISLCLALTINGVSAGTESGTSFIDMADEISQTSNAPIVDKFSDQDLIKILQEEGYMGVSIIKSGKIKMKIEGSTVILYNTKSGDLQFFYGVSGGKWIYEDMNEWNKTKRLTRAYLDSDNDPILESDLLSDGGISKKNVIEFTRVFAISRATFRRFLQESNRDSE